MFKVEAVDQTPPPDGATQRAGNYAMSRNTDLPGNVCFNDDEAGTVDMKTGKVKIDASANVFYHLPEPNFSPKFIITGPVSSGS